MSQGEPWLRVAAGHPTAEETAAVTVALAAVLAARERAARARAASGCTGGWAQRSLLLRAPLPNGPGTWRRSALPA